MMLWHSARQAQLVAYNRNGNEASVVLQFWREREGEVSHAEYTVLAGGSRMACFALRVKAREAESLKRLPPGCRLPF